MLQTINRSNIINNYVHLCDFDVNDRYAIETLDVNETISELAYLTHDFFRYYGKFPSKVGKYIITKLKDEGVIDSERDFIFDNFAGSGTSLVEAKLAGFHSAGIDINPFAVLASRVKVKNYSIDELMSIKEELFSNIETYANSDSNVLSLFKIPNCSVSEDIDILAKKIYMEFPDVEKWFSTQAIHNLSVIKYFLLKLPVSRNREFFSLAFFAIIRRVSKAYDGEVRPHVNLSKKERNAISAFEKKVSEMILTMNEWNHATDSHIESDAVICDNSNSTETLNIVSRFSDQWNKELGLVISHPPYLNCFDYIPVYRLKFLWANGFEEIYGKMDYSTIKRDEIKSYPASTERLVNQYFQHNYDAYKIMYKCLRKNGYCCVVIGDCTIQKELFSVHKVFLKQMEQIGFIVDHIVYRSTSYGLGKYAYKHKADYNEGSEGKKDAILFFKKP